MSSVLWEDEMTGDSYSKAKDSIRLVATQFLTHIFDKFSEK